MIIPIFTSLFGQLGEALRGRFHGWLLFGSGLDIFLACFDVAVTTAVIYFVLKLMSDSRAWQLLKGILFILALMVGCKLLGLSTLNYILSNSLSLLAIGFVVLFQPELRRALETVGRKSIRFIHFLRPNEIFAPHNNRQPDMELRLQKEIEALATACERMAAVKTGALIIIERSTKLGELVQDSAIIVDAAITSTFIEQIFYKGSPLHDGAVLIRGGRIYAARCHVPLSDTYHMRRDYGTRHRAAVGASELGDAVVLVVSEERGHISLAVGGRLYPMENGDSLRVTLSRLLLQQETMDQSSLRRSLRRFMGKKAETSVDGVVLPTVKAGRQRRQKFYLQLTSFFMAVVLWYYVQANINPITTANLSRVNIQVQGLDKLEAQGLTYSLASEQSATNLQFAVRQHNYERINYESVEVEAQAGDLNFAEIKEKLKKQKQVSISLDLDVRVRGLGSGAYILRSRVPSNLLILLRKAN